MSGNPTGHLQVKPKRGPGRSFYAFWRDADGRHGKRLGPAHVKDSGRLTARGGIVWRAGDGPKPTPEHLTPKEAEALLNEILYNAPRQRPKTAVGRTLRDALEGSFEERIREGQLRRSTIGYYDPMIERLCRDLEGEMPVLRLKAETLEHYFEGFEAHHAVSATRAAQRAAQGDTVREIEIVSWTAQPRESVPVEVPTKQQAVRIATRQGGKWKHESPGVYRVTPPGAQRAKRVRRQEALRLEKQGWIVKERTTKRWVTIEPADPQTRNKYRDLLAAALDYAKRHGWIDHNPISEIPRTSLRSRHVRILRREDFYDRSEVAQFLEQLPDPLERAFFELGFDQGLRLPGEGLGLTWGCVDFEARVIRPYDNLVGGEIGDAKTLDPTAIPMSPRTERDLREIRRRSHHTADADRVFVDDAGRAISPKTLRGRFAQAADQAGLKTIPMYNTRHSFGTGLARGGVDVRTIQQLMRHTNLTTTQQYMAYAPQPDLARQMARALAPPSDNEPVTIEDSTLAPLLELLEGEIPPRWSKEIRRLVAEAGKA